MILTFDVENGGIAVCCVENGKKLDRFTLSPAGERSADEYAAMLNLVAGQRGVDLKSAGGAVLVSAAPRLTAAVAAAAEQSTGQKPLIVGPGVETGLNLLLDDPAELQPCLAAAAGAALERFRLPCIVVVTGAAAVGVLNDRGDYAGGLILPALAPVQVGLEAPEHVIGKNARDCIRSGLVYGAAAMLDGVVTRIETELGQAATVAVTGPGAADIVPHCHHSDAMFVDDDLIMRGLWRIYTKNQ